MTDDLERLLEVQELDTAADVLRHRNDHLPERATLEAAQAALAELEAGAAAVREQRHQIARAQQALEDELALLAEKVDGVNAAMYGGSTTNAKELQSLQQELDALGRRQAILEEQVLERMVEAEPVDHELEVLASRQEALDRDVMAATAALAEVESAIASELADIEQRRAALAAEVDPDLLERYEKLRSRFKGVGVARFANGKCDGCHLNLPSAEAEQVRRQARAEGVATCPECDRMLVVDRR